MFGCEMDVTGVQDLQLLEQEDFAAVESKTTRMTRRRLETCVKGARVSID